MLFRLSQDQTPAAEFSAGGAREAASGDRRPAAGEFLSEPLERAASVPQLKWSWSRITLLYRERDHLRSTFPVCSCQEFFFDFLSIMKLTITSLCNVTAMSHNFLRHLFSENKLGWIDFIFIFLRWLLRLSTCRQNLPNVLACSQSKALYLRRCCIEKV